MRINQKLSELSRNFSHTLAKRPALLFASFFFFGLALHIPFLLYDCFGEQDAARLATRAVYGDLVGRLKMGGQWPFSYPLYIHMLYAILRADLLDYSTLPRFMSVFSLISSALFSALFAVFALRATQSLRIAIVAGLGLQLCPVFFFNSIYGFPTITALSFFMAAAVAVQQGILFSKRRAAFIGVLTLAAALFVLGVLFKVDVLLAGMLFLLPVQQSKLPLLKKAALAAGIFATAVGAFWLLNRYGLSLSKMDAASEHWQGWSKNFYTGIGALMSKDNLNIISRAAGALTLPAAVVALILCFVVKQYRTEAVFFIATGLPSALFWSVMAGNSARHNLILAVFAPLLAALPVAISRPRIPQIWGATLMAVFIVNYIYYPPSKSAVTPSGRLVESALMMRDKCMSRKNFGRKIAAIKDNNIFVLAPAHLQPFYYVEVISAKDMNFVKSSNIHLYMKKDGRTKTFVFPIKDPLSLRRAYEKKGFTVMHAKD